MKVLPEKQAYTAMFAFSQNRYRLNESDDLAALLGSMSLLPGAGTADPSIWQDWLNAINLAEPDAVQVEMKLNK